MNSKQPGIETGSVNSVDGTSIGYFKLGAGPPVVIVHGALCAHDDWMAVAEELSPQFTCYVMDRRGRGLSGDAPGYAVEREIEDIQAVLAAAGPGAALVGHSYGGFCSLLTALETPLPRLVIYEAPWPVHGPIHTRAINLCPALLAQGKRRQAVIAALKDTSGIRGGPIWDISTSIWAALPMQVKTSLYPQWPRHVALVPTIVREMAAVDAVGPSLERFASLKMPVLLLLGTRSRMPHILDTTRELVKRVPGAKLVELEGQGHMAQAVVPKLVASEIAAFLSPAAPTAPRDG